MKTTVVTSFSAAGYELYGRRFIETFARYFPKDIGLIIYVEATPSVNPDCGRIEMRSLFEVVAFTEFVRRHDGDPLVAGRLETPVWKAKDKADGYSFRTDAMKFCRKVFALANAVWRSQEGLLVWLDADSFAFDRMPADFFVGLLGDADAAYLGRDGAHSECGFLAFRLPQAIPLIVQWENFYYRDTAFNEREWHDSYLFDRARELAPQVVCRNLTPGGHGHVWERSPLAPYLMHLKGDRKIQPFVLPHGRSVSA